MSPVSPNAAPEAPLAVETAELCRRFGRRWAYARINLKVRTGERLLIVGPNGCGKTTLLRTLATVLRQTQGSLRLFGLDPLVEPDLVRARLTLLSHQLGLYEDLSARDNLRVISRMSGRTANVESLLTQVGLEDRPDPVRAYSAGMRKRLQIAATILQKPDLILLDEPFAALDPAGVAQISQLISEIPGTVILASHQVERAARICDRALLMQAGMQRWQGPANQVWAAWKMIQDEADVAAAGGFLGGAA